MRKNGLAVLALVLCLLSLVLAAFLWLNTDGKLENQQRQLALLQQELEALKAQLEPPAVPELKDYTLAARAWADGNGADVTLTAWPEVGWENGDLVLVVETGEGLAANVPCQWDGAAYTATASLPAANLYSYYLSAGEGSWLALAGAWGNKALECVYLADSLEGYVTFALESWSGDQGGLTLHRGFGMAQLPLFDMQGQRMTAKSCAFNLKLEGSIVSTAPLDPAVGEGEGVLEVDVQELVLPVPELTEGQQVELWLELELSDGRILNTWVCGWTMSGGQLGQVAG